MTEMMHVIREKNTELDYLKVITLVIILDIDDKNSVGVEAEKINEAELKGHKYTRVKGKLKVVLAEKYRTNQACICALEKGDKYV